MQLKNVLYSTLILGALLLFVLTATERYNQYSSWQESVLKETIQYKKKKKKKKYKKIQVTYESPLAIGKYWQMLTTPDGATAPEYPNGYLEEARHRLNSQNRGARIDPLVFKERGPANAPGRTRSILELPARTGTTKRWLAASVTGGIWESTNEGVSWSHITKEVNSLSVSTMTASSDGNTIYAGTGEYFASVTNGIGVLKSTNGGRAWSFLASTENNADFSNVNRIICSPNNPNLVLAATASRIEVLDDKGHIMRSENGGASWTKVLSKSTSMNQIIASKDFSKMYATDGRGDFYKSTDSGRSWKNTYSFKSTRVELAMSSTNEKVIYAQVNDSDNNSTTFPFVWVSYDEGEVFNNAVQHESNLNANNIGINFLGNQGEYDNTILVHPFQENAIYHGGVNLFFSTMTKVDDNTLRYAVYQSPNPFINFITTNKVVNYEEVQIDDNFQNANLKSFEFRFGNKMQKAYRFTVGNRTTGVLDEEYMYRDYVNIPFEVWDTNSKQKLMVSFRDQNNNGEWDLEFLDVAKNTSPASQTREYLFIHTNTYSDIPIADIAKNGGVSFNRICILWPTLHSTLNSLDTSASGTIAFKTTKRLKITMKSKDVADAYGGRTGVNSFDNTSEKLTMHPDHHHLSALLESNSQSWRLLVGNDGGIFVSKPAEIPGIVDNDFFFRGESYNTTQFYSVDKHPTEDRYVGGAQDNGSWITPQNVSAEKTTKYREAYGGDGFEAIWHPTNPNKIIFTSQMFDITISKDGGQTVTHVNSLPDRGTNKFPFYTQIGYSKASPDFLVVMGEKGIFLSRDFGETWIHKVPDTGFLYGNNVKLAVSVANPSYIWAGGGFGENHATYLSIDTGETFQAVTKYKNVTLGGTTGIYTHPLDKKTAYMLFSFYSRPKVLRTTDAGVSWQDISGFDAEGLPSVSTKQFPNVKVYSLLVFPPDGKIWVSTELGILESTDDGVSWHKLESNLPKIPIYQMKLVGNQVVLASHGRGIWTYTNAFNYDIAQPPVINTAGITPRNNYVLDINTRTSYDKLQYFVNDKLAFSETNVVASEKYLKEISGFSIVDGTVNIKLVAEKDGFEMTSNIITLKAKPLGNSITEYATTLESQEDWLLSNMNFGSNIFSEKNTIETPHPLPNNYEGTALLLKSFVKDPDFPKLNFGSVNLLKQLSDNNTVRPNINLFAQLEFSYDGLEWQGVQNHYNASATSESIGTYQRGDVNPRVRFSSVTQLSLENIEDNKPFLLRFYIKNSTAENTNPWGLALDNIYIQVKVVGISDNNFKTNNYKIYPNPADKTLKITLSEAPTSDIYIVINDINGIEKMRVLLDTNNLDNNTFSFTLPFLNNGVYALILVNQSGILFKDKLIIQH